jgi:ABC-2 type transport system permease protein
VTDAASASPPLPATGDEARILDRGYRRYTGNRRGAGGAVRSVAWQGLRSVLGLGRPARTKILPLASIVFAYLPAVAFVGIAAVLPVDLIGEDALPTYADYYGFIISAIVLFCALAAPEVLVGDRRTGMLALYLSTPLDRPRYLVAKVIALAAALAMVTIGPPLLLLVAYTFEGAGPDDVGDWLVLFVRILVAGLAVTTAYASTSMAAASLTDRRAFASVGIILLLLVSASLSAVLVEQAQMSDLWWTINLLAMPFELAQRVYGEPGDLPELSTWTVLAANVAWTLAGGAVVAWRYRRLRVTR